jgi:hypothetical protein
MSLLEVKQAVSRMNKRERRELSLYLLRLRQKTPEWKRTTARQIQSMQSGRGVTLKELEARLSRG